MEEVVDHHLPHLRRRIPELVEQGPSSRIQTASAAPASRAISNKAATGIRPLDGEKP
jgi:hypothetical protein